MKWINKKTAIPILATSINGGTIFASLSLFLSLTRELGNEAAFIATMTATGILLGGLIGTILPIYRTKNLLPIFIGTLVSTIMFGLFVLSINLFFDPDNIRSRLLLGLTLIAWTPLTFVGWFIHLQLTERTRHDLNNEDD